MLLIVIRQESTTQKIGVITMTSFTTNQYAIICSQLEKTNNFEKFLSNIQEVIDKNDEIQVGMLVALSKVIWDSDAVNCWFFEVPVNYPKQLIWLSCVKSNGNNRFVWSVGQIHEVTQTIQNLIKPNLHLLQQIPLLQVPKSPPFLVYFDPALSSKWQTTPNSPVIDNLNELDIFQVRYDGDKPKEHVDQTLVINAKFLQLQGLKLEQRVRDFGSPSLIAYCEEFVFPKLQLLNALHVEVHNWGHFLGYFPFSQSKDINSYESVEEYRACLVGSVFGIKLLPVNISLALCLVIVLNRLLIYGFEPYLIKNEEKTFQDVREITVAVFFYHFLQEEKVLSLDTGKLEIDINQLSTTFCKLGFAIQEMEKATNGNSQELEKYAVWMLKKVYPNKQFPETLDNFWSLLSQKYFD